MLVSFFHSAIRRFLPVNLAIDLGTANTVVYVENEGIVLNEPSVVALKREDRDFIPYKVGNEAKMMLGKTPSGIIAMRPLKDGVIADFKCAEEMIKMFIKKVMKGRSLIGPRIVVCVPSGSTPVERRAIQESTESVGAREVFLIAEPMAAAIGAGLPVTEATGSMIVDIGGGTTEVAILALGGIVYSGSSRVGGDSMDEAIVNYIRHNHNLLIGDSTAERIKKIIGSAMPPENGEDGAITSTRGRDVITGIPREIMLSEKEVSYSLGEDVKKIILAIRIALERAPPELSSDIVTRGITLSGGGALLKSLSTIIAKSTGLPVVVAEDPLACVAYGIGKVLENMSVLSDVLFKQD